MNDLRFRLDQRSAGILLHPTSLAGPFESGDLGPTAHRFVDFVASAGVRWWQMLPLCPVGPGDSPYSSPSVFAGSPLLVSLEHLAEDGLLPRDDGSLVAAAGSRNADFAASKQRRERALRKAHDTLRRDQQGTRMEELDDFCRRNDFWLGAYAEFATLKQLHEGKPFFDWPLAHKLRDKTAMQELRSRHADEIAFHKFVQQRFAKDLAALVQHAHDKGVGLMGDAPIYVAHDSADVWAHPELFQLDSQGDPIEVAGVPPDAFSEDGQLWGNPLYDWAALERFGFGFWIARLGQMLKSFDAVRLDHFIGFSRYYAIKRGAKTAKDGQFHDVPGTRLFEALFKALGPVQLVAEDLGVVTDAVKALRDHFRLPGMGVLQFSFSPGRHAEESRPHRFAKRSVVYTGTHDNDTSSGWFKGAPADASAEGRAHHAREVAFAKRYLRLGEDATEREAVRALVGAAFASHCDTTIVPMQDLLGLGNEARMNRPGIASGNWSFRLLAGEASPELASETRDLAELYGRVV